VLTFGSLVIALPIIYNIEILGAAFMKESELSTGRVFFNANYI
jgi:hypothetical protein